jgi:hypothetical protein
MLLSRYAMFNSIATLVVRVVALLLFLLGASALITVALFRAPAPTLVAPGIQIAFAVALYVLAPVIALALAKDLDPSRVRNGLSPHQ